jgi:hypothetical protein
MYVLMVKTSSSLLAFLKSQGDKNTLTGKSARWSGMEQCIDGGRGVKINGKSVVVRSEII